MMERRGVRRYLKLPNRRVGDTEKEVDAELAAHVAARVEQLMARGLSREAAVQEAERRLGGLAHARHRLLREAWERDRHLSLLDSLRDFHADTRYAIRAVFRERGYALVVIATLALGIGVNAMMFGIVDRLLLSGPAHVERPAELVRFMANVQYDPDREVSTWGALNYPVLAALREGVPSVVSISGYMDDRRLLGSGPDSREIQIGAVSASFFDMAGVRPALGRFFAAAEDQVPQGEYVVVLSWELWQSLFEGRRSVVGEGVELSGRTYTIVGVAPRGFTGVDLKKIDAWTPLSLALARRLGQDWHDNWGSFMTPVVGRLASGATRERAAAEATAAWRALHARVDARRPVREGYVTVADIRSDVTSGREPLEARVSRWLVAVSAIVLLVACANVANLYFARGLRRRREIAVRLSLGISRGRLLRLLFLESVVLALLGGMTAVLVTYWGGSIVRTTLLPDVSWGASPVSLRMLAIAAALTLAVAGITGLLPALQSLSTRLAPALTGSVHSPPPPGRVRNVLAVMQAAFCVILLVGAGLFVRSLTRIQAVDLGMEPQRVLQLQLAWQPADDTPDEERTARRTVFIEEALERLQRIPGVDHVSAAIGSPFHSAYGGGYRTRQALDAERGPDLPGGSYRSAISPDYFATLGTPLLRGRLFQPGEGAGTEPVIILSRSTAEYIWPGEDPLDRCLFASGSTDCTRVVGVVGDVRRFSIDEQPGMQYYVPLGQQPTRMQEPALLVRTSADPERLATTVRNALYEHDPTLQHVAARTYMDSLNPQWRPWKLGATLFVFCGVLALVIAGIGLYSVIAYLVAHRRHEIGVRMALGAERRDVVNMVLLQSVSIAGTGVAIGVAAAAIAAPHIEPLLFATPARDGAVFAATAGTLLLIGLAGGALPAWRASRVPPTEALRDG